MTEKTLPPCRRRPPELLLKGIDQFNCGAYFECHETLEAIWGAEKGSVRRLYQGILQIAVALHHLGRGNLRGAISLCRKGVENLQSFAPVCQQVDVIRLIVETERLREAFEELGPERIQDLDQGLIPRVHTVTEER